MTCYFIEIYRMDLLNGCIVPMLAESKGDSKNFARMGFREYKTVVKLIIPFKIPKHMRY
jgi:hypothetical protein